MAAAGDSMSQDYLLCYYMLVVDSLWLRDIRRELVGSKTAFHLRNFYLMMSHDCRTQSAAINSCCVRKSF